MSRPLGFIVYDSYKEQIMRLDDSQAGALFKALVMYHTEDREPEFSDGVVDMAFSFIRSQLRRDEQKWEKLHEIRSAQGKKGGAPKGNKNACKNKENKQIKQNDLDINKDKDQGKENDKDKEGEATGSFIRECDEKEWFSRVELSAEEEQELVRLSDRLTVKRFISKLSQWQQKNRRLSSKAYVVIKGWIEEEKTKAASQSRKAEKKTSYDLDEFEAFARGYDMSKELTKKKEASLEGAGGGSTIKQH